MKKKKWIIIGIAISIFALIFSMTVFQNNTMGAILCGVIGTIVIFFALFESKNVVTEKIVLIAILSSLATVSRILFSGIPSVQPTSFIIIITGLAFGGEVGFITGAITALSSNLILGQGPWTLWQMFCWGMMGLCSGIFAKQLIKNKILLVGYGLTWGFIFGWIMNFWLLFAGFMEEINLKTIAAVFAASFPMDLAHALSNAVFIAILGSKLLKILHRISIKYGLGG